MYSLATKDRIVPIEKDNATLQALQRWRRWILQDMRPAMACSRHLLILRGRRSSASHGFAQTCCSCCRRRDISQSFPRYRWDRLHGSKPGIKESEP